MAAVLLAHWHENKVTGQILEACFFNSWQ